MAKKLSKFQKLMSRSNTKVAERVGSGQETKYYKKEDAELLKITARVSSGALIFTTIGRWVSLNFIIGKTGWAIDMDLKHIVTEKVRKSVLGIDIKLSSFKIVLFYNSRLDDHNTVMMHKWFTDAIKTTKRKNEDNRLLEDNNGNQLYDYIGIIEEDGKAFSKGSYMIPDPTLAHNEYVLVYIPVDSNESFLSYQEKYGFL